MKLVNIKDSKLIRDTNNMAIINTDNNEYEQYLLKRKLLKEQKQHIDNMDQEIKQLKSDLTEIKQLLLEIIKHDN